MMCLYIGGVRLLEAVHRIEHGTNGCMITTQTGQKYRVCNLYFTCLIGVLLSNIYCLLVLCIAINCTIDVATVVPDRIHQCGLP